MKDKVNVSVTYTVFITVMEGSKSKTLAIGGHRNLLTAYTDEQLREWAIRTVTTAMGIVIGNASTEIKIANIKVVR